MGCTPFSSDVIHGATGCNRRKLARPDNEGSIVCFSDTAVFASWNASPCSGMLHLVLERFTSFWNVSPRSVPKQWNCLPRSASKEWNSLVHSMSKEWNSSPRSLSKSGTLRFMPALKHLLLPRNSCSEGKCALALSRLRTVSRCFICHSPIYSIPYYCAFHLRVFVSPLLVIIVAFAIVLLNTC